MFYHVKIACYQSPILVLVSSKHPNFGVLIRTSAIYSLMVENIFCLEHDFESFIKPSEELSSLIALSFSMSYSSLLKLTSNYIPPSFEHQRKKT